MRIIAVLSVCLMAFVLTQCAGKNGKGRRPDDGPRQSSDFKTWAITSVEGGGIDGRLKEFSINSTGTIIFEDRKNKALAETKTDNAETFARIGALLKQLDLPNTERKSDVKEQECCDQVNHSFIVKLDGRDYDTDNLDFSSAQTSDLDRVFSFFWGIRGKNETTLMEKAAELKVKKAKTLSVSIRDGNYKPVWEGKFSRKGESNVFEGEWKNNETIETVKDKAEVVLNGRTVKITRKGAGEMAVPKEFQGDWDSYSPGYIAKKASRNEINWYAHFE